MRQHSAAGHLKNEIHELIEPRCSRPAADHLQPLRTDTSTGAFTPINGGAVVTGKNAWSTRSRSIA